MGGDFFRRLRVPWLGRREIETEFDDELAHHLEMRAKDLVGEGLTPEEAHRAVRSAYGDIARVRSGYVARRSWTQRRTRLRAFLGGIGLDVRVAVRGLRHRPGFAATGAAVLALGIGGTTTVFSLVDTIFLQRPAHVVEPHRLVRVFRSWAPGVGGGTLENADYRHYRDNATTLAGLAAYGSSRVASYRWAGASPSQLSVQAVSANFFDVLGVPPALGRTFLSEEDEVPGAFPVAVLSHGFWTRSLGAEPDMVGRSIELNGIGFTVVGVVPEGFTGVSPVGTRPDVWVPTAMRGALMRIDPADTAWWERHPEFRSRWLDVVGRVSDGVTIASATANLEALAAALDYPGKDPAEGILVSPQFLYRPSQEASLDTLSRVLLAVAAIVLLIAASNVAVLLLSRATMRWEEIGVRSAIGAGRARIVRQLVVESVSLGTLGGVLGIALAYGLSGLAGSLLPLPFHTDFTPSPTVLAGSVLLTLVTSIIVGLVPGSYGARADVMTLIRCGLARSGGTRARATLVVTQVALSLVLLSAASLFTRSFWTASTEDLGFDRRAGLVTRVELQGIGYDRGRGRRFITAGIERLSRIPGATGVTTSSGVPFGGQWSTTLALPPVAESGGGEEGIEVGLNAVSPGYFEVMDIEIVAGRAFDARDVEIGAPVAVVNETLARAMWPGEDPLGRVVPAREPALTVVGVARDAVYYELGEEQWAQLYLSVQQAYQPTVHFIVRRAPESELSVESTQAALRELEPGLAFAGSTSIEAIVDDALARYEVSAVLVGLFGVIALILMATGLYGVVAFGVSQRSHEIGVRMALGADRTRVARDVLLSGLRLVAIGSVLGVLGAIGARGYTASMLYGVDPNDTLPMLVACAALALVTCLASALPARRAMRLDPVEAIRTE